MHVEAAAAVAVAEHDSIITPDNVQTPAGVR